MRRGSVRVAAGWTLCAVLVAVVGGPRAAGEETSPKERWAALAAQTATRLHALAEWCGEKKLYGSRAEVYESILAVAPEDVLARRVQHYVKAGAGWKRDPKWQPPKNLGSGVKEYQAQREELETGFLDAVAALREETDDPRFRADLLVRALGVAPGNGRARGWNDEVRDERTPNAVRWILLETRNARTRRPMLRKAAADAMAAAPPVKSGTLEEVDARGGIPWPTVLQGEHVRVLGFPPKDELVRTVAFADTAWPLLRAAFGRTMEELPDGARYGAGMSIYEFEDPAGADLFNAAQPGVSDRDREFWRQLVYWWLPARAAAVVKSGHRETRMEAPTRLVLAELVRRGYGLGTERAWIAEGLVIHLTWQITRTRWLFTVNDVQSRYAEGTKGIPDYERRMGDPLANWLDLGLQLIESRDKPDVLLMLGKDFNKITRPDVLYGYCIAAWVVEGLAEKADPFLRAVAAKDGNDLDAVCLRVLGYDVRAMEARVHRWLRETSDVADR